MNSSYWGLPNFPEVILVAGKRFVKAGWRQSYPGVIEQYRGDSPRDSEHLFVYEDGSWAIDHVDDYNPDHGQPLEHFFADHPVGQAIKVTAVLGVGAFVTVSAVKLLTKAFSKAA